ncbi:MAG: tRNA (adenosine(37)-N6)-threonylcarbamoyltransferase complex transferase subunit TsaD [Chloroflexi bacterium]|nr:tRNA (adenosine(37)-N6)-threonylcarbamoyltransferase complex transferase subunit TsaD [Chloroflexota bacterium]
MEKLVLGIETSCDETAAAVVAEGRRILSNIVASQAQIHAKYGGVYPEIASRKHVVHLVPVVQEALSQAGIGLEDLEGIAVTAGPGLPGALVVGVNMAKGLAMGSGRPFIGVNHLEAHLYTPWVMEDQPAVEFPLVALIVSGGHTLLVLMTGHHDYRLLGQTLDDAAGEAFDKVARILGMGYPGGPAIQKAAASGNPSTFDLPRAWLSETYDFSFSGLKTAVLRLLKDKGWFAEGRAQGLDQKTLADIAASFQAAVVDVLVEKTKAAANENSAKQVLVSGGVAANALLRQEAARRIPQPLIIPSPALCTDNAVGVAAAGWFRLQAGQRSGWDLDAVPRLRLG